MFVIYERQFNTAHTTQAETASQGDSSVGHCCERLAMCGSPGAVLIGDDASADRDDAIPTRRETSQDITEKA
jgi:hypothetical protein